MLGGFDETFPYAGGEDSFLAYSLRRSGYNIKYCPDVIAYHEARESLRGYILWQFKRGVSSYIFASKVNNRSSYMSSRLWSISNVLKNSIPLYIGKAVPSGWRTARVSASQGQQLYNRIREHYRNLNAAENLDPTDFKCRYMVLDDDESGIIGPVEASLIRKFEPLWNTVIDGFGNHTPGIGRF